MKRGFYSQLSKFGRRMWFYIQNFASYGVPRCWFRWRRASVLSSLTDQEKQEAEKRARYYCRLQTSNESAIKLGDDALTVGMFKYPWGQEHKFVTYFFDLYNVLKYFPTHLRFYRIFGDVNYAPAIPAFVKSRPVDNHTGVLMKLNKERHFLFVNDHLTFRQKKDMIVSRTTWANPSPQRRLLCGLFWNHPMCNIGKTRLEQNDDMPQAVKAYMTIGEQLQYKFIACVEGNDVATNLKWVMSSNSIAVSPPMKFETWFMEGTLIPNYHYIEVKSDFSDLIEKIDYYIAHPDEAEDIIRHAHEYVSQFKNKRTELATQLMVAQNYFSLTNI